MKIIPVIDLMGGVVVQAKMAAREIYRPIETPLSRTASPVDVVRGLLNVASFTIFYIADIDSILKRSSNISSLIELCKYFPNLKFWIDCGASNTDAAHLFCKYGDLVIGSESQTNPEFLATQRDALLSLDFNGGEFLGPPELLEDSEVWPTRVIVMTLGRVGAGIGPDLERLRSVRALGVGRQVFAAGGVRDIHDLACLSECDVDGVLVSSALHNGKLRLAGY